MSTNPTLTKFSTVEQIYEYLITLDPKDEVYLLVKRFIADWIYDTHLREAKKLYETSSIPFNLGISKDIVENAWNNAIKNINSDELKLEKDLLKLSQKIVKLKNCYSELNSSAESCSVCEIVDSIKQIKEEAKKLGAEKYIEDYLLPIEQIIENHEYVHIQDKKANFRAGLFLFDLELRIYSLKDNLPITDIRKIAEAMYNSLGLDERIRLVIKHTIADKITDQKKVQQVLIKVNKEIHDQLIGRIGKEQVEYFELLVFFENLCKKKGNLPFTDDEIEKNDRIIIKAFKKMSELHKEFRATLLENYRERYDKMLGVCEKKLKRPYGFISFVEKDGKIFAFVPKEKKSEFVEYVKKELAKRFSDQDVINKSVDDTLTDRIKCEWNKIEESISGIIEDIARRIDVEITKKYAEELSTKNFNGDSEEGISTVIEMEILLTKMQNNAYSSLKDQFNTLYAQYLKLIGKTAKSIAEENIDLRQKYEKIKKLELYLHNFNGGQYDEIRKQLDGLRIGLAHEMLCSVSHERIIKNRIRFWSGVGAGIVGVTVFGFGVLFHPWVAPFGVAILPVGMKLIKDGVSELKEKHDEFVKKRKNCSRGLMIKQRV